MKKFHPDSYLTDIRLLETIIKASDEHVGDDLRIRGEKHFRLSLPFYSDIGLTASQVTCKKILLLLSQDDLRVDKFRELVSELHERIIDEMSANLFLSLNDKEADYYTKPWD